MNIFDHHKLYPDEVTPLLDHYSGFDDVFIGLLPFFQLDKSYCDTQSSKKIIPLDEARKNDDLFKVIGNYSNVTIYKSNECYPSDDQIKKDGKIVQWKEIIENTKIDNYKELNKALMTSIGAYHKKLERHDLLEYLNQYTKENNIWHPSEGAFDYFTKASIYDVLKSANIPRIEIVDEFYENTTEVFLLNLSLNEFLEKIISKIYYIYSKDKSILFSIGWDYFFFFIAIKESAFSKELIENHFEGFWAGIDDNHLWSWEKGEIQRLLAKDKITAGNTKLTRLQKFISRITAKVQFRK